METEIQKTKMTSRDFFLYLGILVSLYISSIAILVFIFSALDTALPNNTDYYSDATGSVAWSLSVFIVFYPILIFLSGLSLKNIREFPEKANLSIRNWFIYMTLFITSLTIAIDLIVLISHFLSGEELTLRFILKVIFTIVVSGLIFFITFKDLRGVFIRNKKLFNHLRIWSSLVIILTIIGGIMMIGSPNELRNKRIDDIRVENLNTVQSEIIYFWQSKNRLPNSIEELRDDLRVFYPPTDPDTEESYEYQIVNEKTFKLCANFKTDSLENKNMRPDFYGLGSFEHSAEYTCFERTIDPEKFPPLKF